MGPNSKFIGQEIASDNKENRHSVMDETIGAVVVFCTFGAGAKIRYVQTLTHLLQTNFRNRQDAPKQRAVSRSLEVPARRIALRIEPGQCWRAVADRGKCQRFCGIGHRFGHDAKGPVR